MSVVGIGSWVQRRARFGPDDPALRHGSTTRTYAELAERIRRLANGFRTRGVSRGDRVAWLGPNHPAYLETLFAAASLGAVTTPVNHRLGATEIEAIVLDAAPSLAVVDPSLGELPTGSFRESVEVGEPFEALIGAASDEPIDEPISTDDLAMLMFTSGTTGRSKGVMLTHGNVTWNAVNMLSVVDLRHDDVTIAVAPFFRVGGNGVNVLPVVFMGGCVVVPERMDAGSLLEELERHRVTVGFANPDLLDRLRRSPAFAGADLGSIRLIVTGGAPVPERLIAEYLARGIPLVQGYGLSEAAPVVLILDERAAARKIGAAGRPPPLVDVDVVDADGRTCRVGEIGELLVRGPNVTPGYWRDREASASALRDGWLHTGDAVRADADGDLWIVGRMDDAFEVAGDVVHPGEIERILLLHQAVADAAAVPAAVGADQAPLAFIVLEDGATLTGADLIDHARGALAPHEVPGSVRFVDSLPRSSVGKLLRPELVRMLEI